VGDLETCPWPSFVGRTLSDVFVMEGRLGFTHGESVVLSHTGDVFNFFRATATDLLATDYIDIDSAHPLTSDFHSVVPWGGGMLLLSEAGEYELSGAPMLTPTTVRLDLLSQFGSSPKLRPVSAGSRLFLPRDRVPSGAQLIEYTHPPQESPKGDDVTAFVPNYLRGRIYAMAGEGAYGFLAVACDGDRGALYAYLYEYGEDGARRQGSWSRWAFPAGTEILHLDWARGSLGLLLKRPDGVYLETIHLSSSLIWEV
jgi:hypothetical protein